MNTLRLMILFLLVSISAMAQQIIPLYQGVIPNSTGYKMKELPVEYKQMKAGIRSVSEPSLSVYLPSSQTANGCAVIICPGGGYAVEMTVPEGKVIAETFVKHGITAFVLKYRLPSDSIMKDKSIGPLQDAQQAIKLVRQRAKEWSLDVNKIGIMGFSAGGHLAATAATHFNKAYIPNKESMNLRPDFAVLIYPVISFTDQLTHKGSRDLLLGINPSAEQIKLFSNEQQVTEQTPPTWLTHTGDDKLVSVENSIQFYQALIKNKVPAEMHLYPKGDHGFVLSQPTEEWMQPLFAWMGKNGWMK
ncbi:alpha/beta hydrolase [Rhodocytophaga rosea]|uniref:Alpha/beta hydrolase n=2 Tax=Rhodocytophaga rosea TaxID=2704465 RepID=A0A6C0GV08_9BACT|nr:alpha/beta hydrolase [Rhodocytophaga rosea]